VGEMHKKDTHNQEEIAVLWTNAQPVVSAFVSSIVPGFQDADDILQQVAVAIIKNYDKYDKKRPFVAWAIGIAKNETLMYHRKNSQMKVIFSTLAIQALSQVYEKESTKFNDMRKALDVCITKLKGRARCILEMRYISELSMSRIAQKLGMTNNAVYTTFHRIRLALRDCINQQISSGRIE
jgi:RNA polymerase sigma-70 factor (ECF subfamily)